MARAQPTNAAGFAALPNGTTIVVGQPAQVVQFVAQGGPGMRSTRLPADIDTSAVFETALAELGFREQETLHVDVPVTAAGMRSPAAAISDTIVVRPAPRIGEVQVLLYQDEGGGLSWHLPDDYAAPKTETVASAPRAVGASTFTIQGRTAVARMVRARAQQPAAFRGPITKLGRKIFKVFVLPLLEPLIAEPLRNIVAAVEKRQRAENIRRVDASNYRKKVTEEFTDWSSLAGKRSLLVVHGILSSSEGMLAKLPAASMAELQAHYGGRIIALDQHTLARSPEENARFFLEKTRAARQSAGFEFDVLCHSRGGIVARTLCERGDSLVQENGCRFGRVLFVGTPNRGSPLADADHVLEMVDVYTNLLTRLPDGPAAFTTELLLAVLKLLLHTAQRQLPGVAAMSTSGYIPDVLNASRDRSRAQYAAITANYEPNPERDNSFFVGSFGNRIMDSIFAEGGRAVANDLIVPTSGVFSADGHPSFPIQSRMEFKDSDHVSHTDYFAHQKTHDWIRRHFQIGEQKIPSVVGAIPIDRGGPGPRPFGADPVRGGGPPSGPPPAQLVRYPKMDFPERVSSGESHRLVVSAEAIATRDTVGALVVALAPGETSARLSVTLDAPGFGVQSPAESVLTLNLIRNPETERLEFMLTAAEVAAPTERKLRADFWLGTSVVGSVTVNCLVAPAAVNAGPESTSSRAPSFAIEIPRQRREACDWAITVDGGEEDGKSRFRIRLSSQIPGEEYNGFKAGEVSLDKTISDYVQGALDSALKPPLEGGIEAWLDNFNATLDGLGRRLWGFLPEKFREEYFRLHDSGNAPQSILIHSDEMVMPWELVIPDDAKHKDMKPLGSAHIIGRWRTDLRLRPKTQLLPVGKFCVLNPAYPQTHALPWSVEEARLLIARFPKSELFKPANPMEVRNKLFPRESLQLLHFSGHGQFDAAHPDLSTLLLEGGELPALQFAGAKLLSAAQPIVYLNACSVGQAGSAAGRAGGFAAILLQGGSSGVVAAHWPINDASAMDFSLALYDKLALGRSIGEALQELRLEQPANPTFRAFTYFGDPWVRLNLSALY